MPAPFVEDACFFPYYNFSFFVKNQVFIGVWMNIWIFYSIPLDTLFVFMTIPDCFYYCSSIIEVNVRDGDTSRSSFFCVQECFGYPEFFVFPYEAEYFSFKVCEDFGRDCIESIDCF